MSESRPLTVRGQRAVIATTAVITAALAIGAYFATGWTVTTLNWCLVGLAGLGCLSAVAFSASGQRRLAWRAVQVTIGVVIGFIVFAVLGFIGTAVFAATGVMRP